MVDMTKVHEQANGEDEQADTESVLEEAERIGAARGEKYGDPTPNMAATARLWNAYIDNAVEIPAGGEVEPILDAADVAHMMTLVKIARYQTGDPEDRDNFVDAAGYQRVAATIEGVNDE